MIEVTKLKIKVIKKNAATICATPVVSDEKVKQRAERQMASNISGWVNEFQHRRREEQERAFSGLFALSN